MGSYRDRILPDLASVVLQQLKFESSSRLWRKAAIGA